MAVGHDGVQLVDYFTDVSFSAFAAITYGIVRLRHLMVLLWFDEDDAGLTDSRQLKGKE